MNPFRESFTVVNHIIVVFYKENILNFEGMNGLIYFIFQMFDQISFRIRDD